MFWKRVEEFRITPVLPKNYRSISLRAIEIASDPVALMDGRVVIDFSGQGKLTQNDIRGCINFEIRDGNVGIFGFHDHPDEKEPGAGLECCIQLPVSRAKPVCAAQAYLKMSLLVDR